MPSLVPHLPLHPCIPARQEGLTCHFSPYKCLNQDLVSGLISKKLQSNRILHDFSVARKVYQLASVGVGQEIGSCGIVALRRIHYP